MSEGLERVAWLDVAKGITILLMVLGHTSIPMFLSNFIFAFHMPLFFIASGWTTKWEKQTIISFLIQKILKLGIPFVVYSSMVIFVAQSIGYKTISLRDVILNGWLGYALWFVPVLFFSQMFAKLVLCIPVKWLQITIMLILLILGALLNYNKLTLAWTLCTVPYATFLILLGVRLHRFANLINKPHWLLTVICIVLTIVISQNWRMDLAWNCITPASVLTLGALSGTIMMFSLSSYLDYYFQPLSRLFQKVGKETYLIMAFSQIIIISINTLTSWGGPAKYSCLFLTLILLKLLKDKVNSYFAIKIL